LINVEVFIKGIHSDENDLADMRINANGVYYYKNNKHYICYDDYDKESGETSKSVIKIWNNNVELIKRGAGATHLYFEKGKLKNTYLQTVMGKLFISVDTKNIEIIEYDEDDGIQVKIEYTLFVEKEMVSDCVVEIIINFHQQKKQLGEFTSY
jgi:uncharacterized beta-barrel protein YwiB (DUF1934 family)